MEEKTKGGKMKEYNLMIYEDFSIIDMVARTIIAVVCLYVLGTNIEEYNGVVLAMGLFLILYAIDPLIRKLSKKKLIKYVSENEIKKIKEEK